MTSSNVSVGDRRLAAVGLRERSKSRRRRRILHAALRLFAEQGYDHTTIADIADAAEVAPRTVTGYFASKLDFITESPGIRTRRLVDLYHHHPDIEFVELVDLWWKDARDSIDPDEAVLTKAMADANPGVVAMAEAEVDYEAAQHELPTIAPAADEPDRVIQSAGRAAVRGVNHAYFRALADGQMTEDVHQTLLELLRSITTATHLGHGALAPPRGVATEP